MSEIISLEMVLKELHNISGFRISVHDIHHKEIASYPKELTRFCGMMQQDTSIYRSCVKNDSAAFDKVKKDEQPYIYRCQFGLYEAVAPLYYSGILSGYLMMGQALDTSIHTKEEVYRLSRQYVSNPVALKEAIESIPAATKDKISSCINIMGICAEYITLSNRFKASTKNLAQDVKKYIQENYEKKITLEILCKQFYCSKATLTHSFKKTYGETISHFMTLTRLEKAEKLLAVSDMKIGEIATRCGFADQNYFCKVFIKVFGITPNAYRKKNREL